MDLKKLGEILKDEPKYRWQQVNEAIFKKLISHWSEASNLPVALREKLEKEYSLALPAEFFISENKSAMRVLFTLADGLQVETVLIRHKDERNTVCVSTQVGCPLACLFCATGQMGFKRNLTTGEIMDQVLLFARYLKENGDEKVNHVVFMGMGEPFLNYEDVILAIKKLNDPKGFGLGMRRFSISTAGIPDKIRKFAGEKMEANLAISLHAPDDRLRSRLMPINRQYNIKQVLEAVDFYIKKTKRQVMFEYLMIDGVNDEPEMAETLAKLMKKPLYMVNLIIYNPTGRFRPSTPEKIKKFKSILEKERIRVTQRYSFGGEIKAACGQLLTRNS